MSDDLALGRQIRAARVRQAIRQTNLATASKAALRVVSAIEHGRLDDVRLGTLRRVGAALGLRIDLQVIYSRGDLRHLTDEAHAALVEAVAALLREAGWEVAVELGFSGGSIDLLGWHAASRTLLIVEVKPRLTDFQGALHQLGRYERLAPIVVRDRGWEPEVTARLLVVGLTRSNRRVIQSHANAMQAALPQRNVAVRRWLLRPEGRIDGLIGLPLSDRAASHVHVRVRPRGGRADPAGAGTDQRDPQEPSSVPAR